MAFPSLAHDLKEASARSLRLAASGPHSKFAAALLALLFGFALMVSAKHAEAHPHAWIDVAVRVVFDSSGNAIGLRQIWLFDELYTAFAMEGLAKKGSKPMQADIDALMHRNMKNLADFSYFT